jgi:hypothetical protein
VTNVRQPARPPNHEEPPADHEGPGATLDALLDAATQPEPGIGWPTVPENGCIVAACTDDRHPSLVGRVRVAWKADDGQGHERWFPTVRGLAVRTGDRVLVSRPHNWPELIVTAVVDGFDERPVIEPVEAARLELRPDEVVVVADGRGRPLLEIRDAEGGPVLRLRQPGLSLEAPGHLSVKADAITLQSEVGPVRIQSNAQVAIEGETILLN